MELIIIEVLLEKKDLVDIKKDWTNLKKEISLANDHSADVEVKGSLVDSSAGASFQFFIKTLTTDSSENAVSNVLNLEAGDGVSFSADVSNVVTGVVSYALIDRSQENG